MAVTLNKTSYLIRDLIDDGKAIGFRLDLLKLHLLDVLNDDLIDLKEFLNDARMFQLQHDLHKLPEFQHVLRVVDVLIEEFLEVGVLARFFYHFYHVYLLVLAAAGKEEPAIELDVLLLAFFALVVLIILGCLGFFVVDVLSLVGDEGGAVFGPVFLDVLDLWFGLFLALCWLTVHSQ